MKPLSTGNKFPLRFCDKFRETVIEGCPTRRTSKDSDYVCGRQGPVRNSQSVVSRIEHTTDGCIFADCARIFAVRVNEHDVCCFPSTSYKVLEHRSYRASLACPG